jgi:hypothetical protein
MINATEIAKPLKRTNPGPIDALYGPYDSLEVACYEVKNTSKEVEGQLKNFRTGQVVGIITPEGIKEYWWAKGTADADLVLKNIDISGLATQKQLNEAVDGLPSKEEFNSLSLGIGNAAIDVPPSASILTYNVTYPGTYVFYNGLTVTAEDLDGAVVQFRKIGSNWVKSRTKIPMVNLIPSSSNDTFIII